MNARRMLDYGLLVCAVGLSRILCRSRYLYDVDSVNFALALHRFDPSVHQPHPPGYFLYVQLGRLAHSFIPDANTALVAISVVASCAAAAMIYALADAWFGRRAAVFAGLIFLFSPLSWFHGTVALTYILEAFFSALIGYLCWQTYSGRTNFLVPSAIALGLAAGFRQSSILFLGPLWLLSLRKVSRRQALAGGGALLLTLLAWFVPMVQQSGGLGTYFGSLYGLWRLVPARETAFSASILLSVARFCTIIGIFGTCFGTAAILLPGIRRSAPAEPAKKVFAWIWIAPGLLFFTFVFLKYVNSGYLLVVSPPVFAWMGCLAAAWYTHARAEAHRKIAVAASLAATNVAFFLYAPIYCSHQAVKQFEKDLLATQGILRRLSPAEDTLIIGFDSHFLGYRHAGYYLPDYWTVQFPEVPLPMGRRVFALKDRSTSLLSAIPVDRFRTFVLFPLQGDKPYKEYVAGICARFPKGALRSEVVDGREFFFGSTADLAFLFPSLAPSSAVASTTVHSAR